MSTLRELADKGLIGTDSLLLVIDERDERIAELEQALEGIRDCLNDGDTCNIETALDIANKAPWGGE